MNNQPQQETAQHTPGPWVVENTDRTQKNYLSISTACEFGFNQWSRLAEVCISEPSGEANARLIASAPKLLAERDQLKALCVGLVEALKYAIDYSYKWKTQLPGDFHHIAQAALAKASQLKVQK